MDFDGEVRTAKFTKPAPNAQIRVGGINLAIPERENLLGAEGDANIAALAPALPNNVFEESLLFAHNPTLFVLSAITRFGLTHDLPMGHNHETGVMKLRILVYSIPYEAWHVKVLISINAVKSEIQTSIFEIKMIIVSNITPFRNFSFIV